MSADHLLPANATALEQSLSLASDPAARLGSSADAIRSFKTDPADSLLPWLVWEYGLGELLPYLPEPRQAIVDGVRWQRIRGTPAALTTALSWIGLDAHIEQEIPGVHFAEFQIDPGKVLDSDETIANLVAIARLSAPARSRLARIYHGYDLRRFVLNDSPLGEALLSDYSGVFWRDGVTKLSFGRRHSAVVIASNTAAIRFTQTSTHSVAVPLWDRFILNVSRLGDKIRDVSSTVTHSHLSTAATHQGVADPGTLLPARRFVRAQIVLSDGPRLGDINACLSGAMTERFFVEHKTGLSLGIALDISGSQQRLTTGAACNDTAQAVMVHARLWCADARWQGQTWSGVRWPRSSWRDTREIIGSNHTTQ